jgi:hypothetical protein
LRRCASRRLQQSGTTPFSFIDITCHPGERRDPASLQALTQMLGIMKTPLLCVLLLCASLCGGEPAQNERESFIAHFHDDSNVADYLTKIDALIDTSEARIYPSEEAEKQDTKTPSIETENGIYMLYTITHTKDEVLIHFSASRPPYLATPFGKRIVGLFMERSSWPKPSIFMISKDQVFHAMWLVSDSEFERVHGSLSRIHAEIRKDKNAQAVFFRALMNSNKLEQVAAPDVE